MHDARRLMEWFAASRRRLPWRLPFPRDPYRVLVSEVLLQQTQVARVAQAFTAFLERFPTVEHLAAADEDAVVHAFSGLGYYRRARLLHATARAVVAAGGWPRSAEGLVRLPGIGPYTAAAVAAFAFGGDTPPVDGNLERVAARTGALELEKGSVALRQAAAAMASSLFAAAPAPDLWEALMELGATVCTPARPRCSACPLASSCAGRARGAEADLPRPRKQRPSEARCWVALWATRRDGRVALRRVPTGELLAGLWLPPLAVVSPDQGAAAVARSLADALGLATRLEPGPALRHSITHHRITVAPYAARLDAERLGEPGELRWQDPDRLTLPTSSLTAKIRNALTLVIGSTG